VIACFTGVSFFLLPILLSVSVKLPIKKAKSVQSVTLFFPGTRPSHEKAVDIDTALALTEHRWFHWKLLLIAGFTFLASGFEFTLHAYILPFAECDLKIQASDMGVINAVFLGGKKAQN